MRRAGHDQRVSNARSGNKVHGWAQRKPAGEVTHTLTASLPGSAELCLTDARSAAGRLKSASAEACASATPLPPAPLPHCSHTAPTPGYTQNRTTRRRQRRGTTPGRPTPPLLPSELRPGSDLHHGWCAWGAELRGGSNGVGRTPCAALGAVAPPPTGVAPHDRPADAGFGKHLGRAARIRSSCQVVGE